MRGIRARVAGLPLVGDYAEGNDDVQLKIACVQLARGGLRRILPEWRNYAGIESSSDRPDIVFFPEFPDTRERDYALFRDREERLRAVTANTGISMGYCESPTCRDDDVRYRIITPLSSGGSGTAREDSERATASRTAIEQW